MSDRDLNQGTDMTGPKKDPHAELMQHVALLDACAAADGRIDCHPSIRTEYAYGKVEAAVRTVTDRIAELEGMLEFSYADAAGKVAELEAQLEAVGAGGVGPVALWAERDSEGKFKQNTCLDHEPHFGNFEPLYSAPLPQQIAEPAEDVNETNAVLASRYFELLKVVEAYEKHGVTCQTFRHFVDAPCAECNSVVGAGGVGASFTFGGCPKCGRNACVAGSCSLAQQATPKEPS